MDTDEFVPVGDLAKAEELRIAASKSLVDWLKDGRVPFVTLVEARILETGAEAIILEVEVERPQRRKFDIRTKERVAVIFTDDNTLPETCVLRRSFPLVPHINLRPNELPRSLCLYDEEWDTVRLRWTPQRHVARIREWLAMTAEGVLHTSDQPLEPFLAETGLNLIVPYGVLDANHEKFERLELFSAHVIENIERCLLGLQPPPGNSVGGKKIFATTFLAPPQEHGLIRRTPSTLSDVGTIVREVGLDIIVELRKRLRGWQNIGASTAQLVIMVVFPKTRREGAEVEAADVWAFHCTSTLPEIGEDIGILSRSGGYYALLVEVDESRSGGGTKVIPLKTYLSLTPSSAAQINGQMTVDKKIVAVGCGALGSQIQMNLARAGFRYFTLVDRDILLPHNLARHALTGEHLGTPKTLAMAETIGTIFFPAPLCPSTISADVLKPSSELDRLKSAYMEATDIIDTSASIPVARHLSRSIESHGRRTSVFLNPQGSDLVLLIEDRARTTSLDSLEMQYYRGLANEPRLVDHLGATGQKVRYGHSCRDFSSTIPQAMISLHAGIAAAAIRDCLVQEEALIRIWRLNRSTLEVSLVTLEPQSTVQWKVGEWTVVTDEAVIGRISSLRQEHLPNETGGILIGTHDLPRKLVYLADVVASPIDSEQWPTMYIRGTTGLKATVQRLSDCTAGNLTYVGEWHSHPSGAGIEPSEDDGKVLEWVSGHFSSEGLPGLILIAGDNQAVKVVIR